LGTIIKSTQMAESKNKCC